MNNSVILMLFSLSKMIELLYCKNEHADVTVSNPNTKQLFYPLYMGIQP